MNNNNLPKKLISPHVSIYKFPLPAISSISNRITGVALSGLFLGYGIGNLVKSDFNDIIINKYQELSYPLKFGLSSTIVIPTTYHTIGGLRHFYLDKFPKNLNNSFMNKSSIVMFTSTLLISSAISHYMSKKIVN